MIAMHLNCTECDIPEIHHIGKEEQRRAVIDIVRSNPKKQWNKKVEQRQQQYNACRNQYVGSPTIKPLEIAKQAAVHIVQPRTGNNNT